MVFKTAGAENLDAVINVRLTTQEKLRLADDADWADMSMSALIRARYFGRQIVASPERKILAELRRVGGFMKHIQDECDGAYSEQTAEGLRLVQEYIKTLAAKIK